MDMMLWVILGVAFAVAEIFTATLFLIMFSVGAAAAAAAAAAGASIPLQAGVFVVVSALTVAGLRPVLRRRLGGPGAAGMGTDPMPGASAVVVEEVNADQGMVKIDGEFWQARSLEGSYPPGEQVGIVDVREGVVMVWRDDLLGLTDHHL
ncbi:NfeD family protein [Actinoplanes sp. NPDC026619]|uniref:NfeD family protein n=1 Tax=Actinoplanes sp. NPDC026619 TaxID=3155798 RepID=UPI0034072C9B